MVIVEIVGALRGGLVRGVQTACPCPLVVGATLWAVVTKLWELDRLDRTVLKPMSVALRTPLGACRAAA